MTKTFSDSEILDHIRAGGPSRQTAIAAIYRRKQLKNQIVAFVTKNSGNREDGIDIFHEGIIALDDNIRKGTYEGRGQLSGYLFTVCRFLWLNKLKKNKRMVYTAEDSELDQVNFETPEVLSLNKEQKKLLDMLVSQVGEKCSKILEMWKLSYSMEDIATEVGLKNAGIARKHRYNCFQKLLKIMDKSSNLRNMLK